MAQGGHPVRVGVIGTGFGAAVHVPGFLELPGVVVQGVAGRGADRVEEVARQHNVSMRCSDWKELITSPDIDAVSITAPQIVHEEMALAALSAGKHVLCEKPLAMNTVQARRMYEAARTSGLVHMVNFEFVEIPAWRCLKGLLLQGELGTVRHVDVEWTIGSWANPERPWSWQCDKAQGGGVMRALGVHSLHYIEWFFGPIARLIAHTGTAIPDRPDQHGRLRPVTAEDHCHAIFEMRGGFPVTFSLSNVAPEGNGHSITVHGDNMTAVLRSRRTSDYGRGFSVLLRKAGSNDWREQQLPPPAVRIPDGRDDLYGLVAPFAALAKRFIDAIQSGERDVRPSFADGLRAQVLLDAVDQSQKEGIWMDIAVPQK